MRPGQTNRKQRRVPLLQGLLPIEGSHVPGEIVAGMTLAALAIPEVMGYTQIAGTPVITGLYTLLLPMALFALLGSSRHLVVGADSATAAMLAAGLVGVATSGSAEYVALASVLALMAAGFLFLARVVRLGFLADFLSRTVLVGFLTGVGIQVALGQISGMLGVPGGGHGPIGRVLGDWRRIEEANPYAVGLSVAALGIIVGSRWISKRVPGPLIAVLGAILASWALDLGAKGVHVLGTMPSGLPTIGLPEVEWSWPLLQTLFPTAFAMFIVILSQSAATSRAYAARYNENFSENVDLVGLGAANVGAALSGTFVVNGSPTKTQMVDGAGGHSQLAHIITTVIVLLVLLFLTAPLAFMPEAVLASVVFLIGVELIDVKGMRRIFTERRAEFWVALLTAAFVVFWGVEQGILIAIFLSLVAHTRHGYRPKNSVVVEADAGHWRARPVTDPGQLVPGLLVYRFNHSMYYANAEQLSEQVPALVTGAEPSLKWFCIDFSAVDDVDFSAAETLRSIHGLLQEKGIRLVFAQVSEHVKAELDRSRLTDSIGAEALYPAIVDVVDAFQAPNVP